MEKAINKSLCLSPIKRLKAQSPLEKAIQGGERIDNNSYTCYIPEKVNLEEIIIDNPPNFKFQIDEAKYILHLISAIRYKRKKDKSANYKWQKKDYPFTMLHAQLLQRRVRKFNLYLSYFIKIGLIASDGFYIPRKKSLGYKFTEKYLSPVKEHSITKKTLLKSLSKTIRLKSSDSRKFAIDVNIEDFTHLSKWFNDKLTINYEEASEFIEKKLEDEIHSRGFESAVNSFNQRKIGILKMKYKKYDMKFDTTAGRLHTNLTQISGDLRKYIRYDGKSLVAIDIKNSQPYLLLAFLNPDLIEKHGLIESIKLYNHDFNETILSPLNTYYDSKNVQEYLKLASSGKLYERFIEYMVSKGLLANDLSNNDEKRKIVKSEVLTALYSKNKSIGFKPYMQAFKELFPDVYKIIYHIKKGKKNAHCALACSLQNFEAKLVLDIATRKIALKYPNLPIFTIHDSIVTTEGNEHLIYDILSRVLLNNVGIEAELEREPWSA